MKDINNEIENAQSQLFKCQKIKDFQRAPHNLN